MGVLFTGSGGIGSKTANAGTKITFTIPGAGRKFTHLTHFNYTSGSAQHTVTVMPGVDWTVVNAIAASGQAVVVLKKSCLNGNGSAIGSGDYVTIKYPDGTWGTFTVSSVSSDGLTVTLASNLAQALNPGARFVVHGQASQTAHANNTFKPTTSATTEFPATIESGSLIRSNQANECLIVQSDNATAAGTFNNTQYCYTQGG